MSLLSERIRNNVAARRILGGLFHLVGIILCWWLSFQVRFDFVVADSFFSVFTNTLWIVIGVYLVCIVAFRLYQGLWRFFTFYDCFITGIAFLVGTVAISGAVFIWNGFTFEEFPRSVFVINYLLLIAWEVGGRGMVRLIREWRIERLTGSGDALPSVVLVGNPEDCDSLIRSLNRQAGRLGEIAAIVTSLNRHRGGRMHGIRVFSDLGSVGQVMKKFDAGVLVILPPFNAPNKVHEIVKNVSAENVRCEYRVVPSIDDIAAGRVDVSQIRRVQIEDLLNRKAHKVDMQRLKEFVSGRRLMVTGAGGSIGSEIARQLLQLEPQVMVLFDVSEFLLFEIERELKDLGQETDIIAVTGDVKDGDDVKRAINLAGGIDVVYHAAAYKHVDLMERNPVSCFENNVLGTATVAEQSEKAGVKQFVLVSTDKAVRPTSLMGASKRLAEMVLMDRPENRTQFCAVRFGNVLGSSGSVVPIFRKQIENGGPLTVTSRDVTRFFMTIPEAVELVLVAGTIGEDRRILVLEMGEPVKIDSLARRMIELSGFVPEVDIPIIYTGLKPGEKEYEELLTDDENVERTEVERIWVVKDQGGVRPVVDVDKLLEIAQNSGSDSLRKHVQSLISGALLERVE